MIAGVGGGKIVARDYSYSLDVQRQLSNVDHLQRRAVLAPPSWPAPLSR